MKKNNIFAKFTFLIIFGSLLLLPFHTRADDCTCTKPDTQAVDIYCAKGNSCVKVGLPIDKRTGDLPDQFCSQNFNATFRCCYLSGNPKPPDCEIMVAEGDWLRLNPKSSQPSAPVAGTGTTQPAQPKFNPDWTQDECTKAGGDWLPDAGKTSGQYCFAKQNIDYTPQISIGGGKIANLGDYVAKAYNYALGFVLMIAIIMVMIGGVQYVLARGGGGVEAAKKRISNAVLGVILLFAAYLILNTISPAIVKLSLPRVPLNKANKFAFSDVSNCGGYKDAASCNANAVGVNKGWACYAPVGTTSAGCKWDAAAKICSLAPPPAAGGLYSQCPDGKCNEGLNCVTVLATGNCKLCTDKKAGSPCGSGSDCENGVECDENTKQCRGEMNRPIGSVCDTAANPPQCATGFNCDPSGGGLRMTWYTITSTGICKSGKILEKEGVNKCGADEYRLNEVWSSDLQQYVATGQAAGSWWYAASLQDDIRQNKCVLRGDTWCFYDQDCKEGLSCRGFPGCTNCPVADASRKVYRAGKCQR